MPEHLQAQPEQQHQQSDVMTGVAAAALAASMEAGAEEPRQTHTIERHGVEYQTDLPEGIDIFKDNEYAEPLEEELILAETDKLPIGTYTVTGQKDVSDGFGGEQIRDISRTISIVPVESGKAVTIESLGDRVLWPLQVGTGDLLNDMGYVVDDVEGEQTLVAVPTPETAQAAVKKLGVDLEYLETDEEGYIDGKSYLTSYAAGKYPASKKHYQHDVEDDHLTAMVLGGDLLRDTLQTAARESLVDGDQIAFNEDGVTKTKIDLAASRLDDFTATLRGVIAPHRELAGEQFSAHNGRRTLRNAGAALNIDAETVDAILATTLASAKKYHLPITDVA